MASARPTLTIETRVAPLWRLRVLPLRAKGARYGWARARVERLGLWGCLEAALFFARFVMETRPAGGRWKAQLFVGFGGE